MTDCGNAPVEPETGSGGVGRSKPAGECAEVAGGESAARQRLDETERTVQRIARALGISESEAPGDLPDLAGVVKDLEKRLDALEATTAGGALPDEPLGAGG